MWKKYTLPLLDITSQHFNPILIFHGMTKINTAYICMRTAEINDCVWRIVQAAPETEVNCVVFWRFRRTSMPNQGLNSLKQVEILER